MTINPILRMLKKKRAKPKGLDLSFSSLLLLVMLLPDGNGRGVYLRR
jgi:hypothetical protein